MGLKIDNITLEIFELLFKVSLVSRTQRLEILRNVSSKLDLLKILLRLANDNKDINTKTYLNLQQNLQEIGKMTGGWIRYIKNS